MPRNNIHRPTDGIAKPTAPRGLDARSLERIGSSLKAHYEDLVRTPIPDKFLELLDQLEANERTSSIGSAGKPG